MQTNLLYFSARVQHKFKAPFRLRTFRSFLIRAKRARVSCDTDMSFAGAAHFTISFVSSSPARLVCPRSVVHRPSRCRQRCCASAATVSRPTEHLASWVDRHPKDLHSSRVETKGSNAVLATTVSVQSGQTVLNVPDSSWLSLQVVAKSRIGSAVSSLEPWLQLAVYVLFGLSQGDPDWLPYLLSLPISPDVPVLWDDKELDELEGTQLLSTVQGYRCSAKLPFLYCCKVSGQLRSSLDSLANYACMSRSKPSHLVNAML